MFNDAFDRAVLTGSITTLEDYYDFLSMFYYMFLEPHELDLGFPQRLFILSVIVLLFGRHGTYLSFPDFLFRYDADLKIVKIFQIAARCPVHLRYTE